MSQKEAKAERQAQRLKVWKIDLAEYQFEGRMLDEKGQAITRMIPYKVKESLAAMLFLPDLKLTLEEAFKAKELADRVRASDSYILLDSAEMTRIRQSYNIIRGPGEHELEFFRRIKEAKEVEAGEIEDATRGNASPGKGDRV